MPTYVTWDPATLSNMTLSGGDLVATNTATSSTNQGARVAASAGRTSGKIYFEITLTTITGGFNYGIGIGTPASTYPGIGDWQNAPTSGAVIGAMMFRSNGDIWGNGVNSGFSLGTRSTGNVMGVAVDLDSRKIWFRADGSANWNQNSPSSNNPVTGVGGATIPPGTMVPFVTQGGLAGAVGNVATANFGSAAFFGAAPSGFASGWTADLPVTGTLVATSALDIAQLAARSSRRRIQLPEDYDWQKGPPALKKYGRRQ